MEEQERNLAQKQAWKHESRKLEGSLLTAFSFAAERNLEPGMKRRDLLERSCKTVIQT